MFPKLRTYKILNNFLTTALRNERINKNLTYCHHRKPLLKYPSRAFCSVKSRTNINDYEKAKKEFVSTTPKNFNFASDVLDVWANKELISQRDSKIPAFWFLYESGNEVKWNFKELMENSKKTANVLQNQCGLKKGDSIMVILPKIPEFWLFNVAAIRTGIILSPGSMQLREKDINYRLRTLKPKCIIAEDAITDIVDMAAVGCSSVENKIIVSSEGKKKDGWLNFQQLYESASSDHQCIPTASNDPMMIFFTSGTTGSPKMVEHTQASYGIGHFSTGRFQMDLTERDILWNLSDTGWAKTAYGLFGIWSMGACVFIHEMPRYSSSLVTKVLKNYAITTFCAPATVYLMLMREEKPNLSFPNLTHCISGGEAVTAELVNSWEKITGLKVYTGYGLTESVMLIGMFKCLKFKPGSMGKAPPGIDIVIIDENENELGPNEIGEIAVKRKPIAPVCLFTRYKDEPEKTRSQLTENYFKTGDLAHIDEDGYFWFKGRNDDIINSAGYRIGPTEVEEILLKHKAVVDAAVVSSPDPKRGEVVKAFIVLSNDFSNYDKDKLTEELQSFVKSETAPYKYPRKVEFIKELPRTVSGKVKRYELRDKEWNPK